MRGQKWWRSPYSFREKLDFLKYRILSPRSTPSPMSIEEGIMIERGVTTLLPCTDEFSIVFTGDLMPFGEVMPKLSNGLIDFLRSSDYIVFNLEGVITEKKRVLALSHSSNQLLEYLNVFGSENVVLNVANNHSSDFGDLVFERQNEMLQNAGFLIVGDSDAPLSLDGKVSLFASTYLSNQIPINKLPITTKHLLEWQTSDIKDDRYNIFMPHWGYEMHLSPTQEQIIVGQELLSNAFDAIVGNHSHTPQPIYLLRQQNVLATSLGNFGYLNHNPNHWFGSILKLSFLRENNPLCVKPHLSKVEVRYIRQSIEHNRIELKEVISHDYKDARKYINYSNSHFFIDLLK